MQYNTGISNAYHRPKLIAVYNRQNEPKILCTDENLIVDVHDENIGHWPLKT